MGLFKTLSLLAVAASALANPVLVKKQAGETTVTVTVTVAPTPGPPLIPTTSLLTSTLPPPPGARRTTTTTVLTRTRTVTRYSRTTTIISALNCTRTILFGGLATSPARTTAVPSPAVPSAPLLFRRQNTTTSSVVATPPPPPPPATQPPFTRTRTVYVTSTVVPTAALSRTRYDCATTLTYVYAVVATSTQWLTLTSYPNVVTSTSLIPCFPPGRPGGGGFPSFSVPIPTAPPTVPTPGPPITLPLPSVSVTPPSLFPTATLLAPSLPTATLPSAPLLPTSALPTSALPTATLPKLRLLRRQNATGTVTTSIATLPAPPLSATLTPANLTVTVSLTSTLYSFTTIVSNATSTAVGFSCSPVSSSVALSTTIGPLPPSSTVEIPPIVTSVSVLPRPTTGVGAGGGSGRTSSSGLLTLTRPSLTLVIISTTGTATGSATGAPPTVVPEPSGVVSTKRR